MKLDDFVSRVDSLINLGQSVLSTRKSAQYASDWVDEGKIKGFRSASLSFIELVYGLNHTYYRELSNSVKGTHPDHAVAGIEILKAIKDELSGGWLTTVKELVVAEVFSDFIEMAEHFLQQGYKDAAAVMAGSVLEEHLRKLAEASDIPIEIENDEKSVPKKADRLNSDLAKAEIYNKLDQKAITTWLDMRNKAAHGKYEEYSKDQVALMIQGIIDFTRRTR